MRRGTTPTHTFMVDIDLRDAVEIFITYAQKADIRAKPAADCMCLHEAAADSNLQIVLEKTLPDITVEEDRIVTRLTQDETLAFRADKEIMIQIAAKFADGSAIRSNIIYTDVQDILKDEVI